MKLNEFMQQANLPPGALSKHWVGTGEGHCMQWTLELTLATRGGTPTVTARAGSKKQALHKAAQLLLEELGIVARKYEPVSSEALQSTTASQSMQAHSALQESAALPGTPVSSSSISKLMEAIQATGLDPQAVLHQEVEACGQVEGGAAPLWRVTLTLHLDTAEPVRASATHGRKRSAKALAAQALLPSALPLLRGSAGVGESGRAAQYETYTHDRVVTASATAAEIEGWLASIVEALSDAEEAVEGADDPLVTIGFDSEWHAFAGVGAPVQLVQLATPSRVLIAHTGQLLKEAETACLGLGELVPSLLLVLVHPAVRKVGRNLVNDAAALLGAFGEELPSDFACSPAFGYFDVTHGSKMSVHSSADSLSMRVLRKHFPKSVNVLSAKWKWPLSEAEQLYAANDAALPLDAFAALEAQRQKQ